MVTGNHGLALTVPFTFRILSDATGVPDLYAHMGPTLKRLLPWKRNEPSALTGRARLFVTGWVLVIVPILLGTGERLFAGAGADLHGLQLVKTVAMPNVVHLKFEKRG